MRSHLRGCLVSRGELDQRRLAERRAEEADAQRHAEHHARRHLHDGISGRCRQSGRAEDEVVAVEQVGRPRGVVRRRDHRIEMELSDCRVNAVHAGVVVDRQRLVVRQAAELRLRIVRPRGEGVAKLEEVLVEERHLLVRVGIVEVDGALQRPASHRHAARGSRREVFRDVVAEIEAEDQELAVGGWEVETGRVQVDHRCTCGAQCRESVFDRVHDRLRSRHERVESAQPRSSDAKARAAETVRIHELRVVGGNASLGVVARARRRTRLARSLPAERNTTGCRIASIEGATLNGAERSGRVSDGSGMGADRILGV